MKSPDFKSCLGAEYIFITLLCITLTLIMAFLHYPLIFMQYTAVKHCPFYYLILLLPIATAMTYNTAITHIIAIIRIIHIILQLLLKYTLVKLPYYYTMKS